MNGNRPDDGQWHLKSDPFPAEAVRKYVWLNGVAASHGFAAPDAELLAPDREQRVAVRLIHGFVTLRESYVSYLGSSRAASGFLAAVREAGRALAAIHRAAVPEDFAHHVIADDLAWELRAYGLADCPDDPPVPLHGDFGFYNVGTFSRGTIAIIDPCANLRTMVRSHLVSGSRYLDIGKMLACLEGQIATPKILLASQRKVCAAQSSFLGGYAQGGGEANLEAAFAFSAAIFTLRNRRASWVRQQSTRLMFNSWRGNATLQGKMANYRKYAQ